jgi:hypothetical protein
MCTVALDPLGGLRCAICTMAPDPTSLLGGLQAAMCPVIPCGLQASSIKKSLAGLPVQLDPHVSNAHT